MHKMSAKSEMLVESLPPKFNLWVSIKTNIIAIAIHLILVITFIVILIKGITLFYNDTWYLTERSSSATRTIHMFENKLGEQILMIYNPLAFGFNIALMAFPGIFIIVHLLGIFFAIRKGSKFFAVSLFSTVVVCVFIFLLVWVANVHEDIPYKALSSIFNPRKGL